MELQRFALGLGRGLYLHSKGTGDRSLFLTREFSPKNEN
jgi:hypothetical protein